MTLKLRALALLSPLLLALPLNAQEQDQDQPAVAFGSGSRMVRGTVTAVTPDHLTLKTESGELYQVAVTPNTQVRKGRDPVKFAEVHPGDGVGAMGEVDRPTKTVHALMLMVVSAEQLKKAREDMGKTYITGKITAIDADTLKLTILRSDGVSQTITVDEGTSFKRGGRGFRMAMTGQADFGGPGASGAPPSRTPRPGPGRIPPHRSPQRRRAHHPRRHQGRRPHRRPRRPQKRHLHPHRTRRSRPRRPPSPPLPRRPKRHPKTLTLTRRILKTSSF